MLRDRRRFPPSSPAAASPAVVARARFLEWGPHHVDTETAPPHAPAASVRRKWYRVPRALADTWPPAGGRSGGELWYVRHVRPRANGNANRNAIPAPAVPRARPRARPYLRRPHDAGPGVPPVPYTGATANAHAPPHRGGRNWPSAYFVVLVPLPLPLPLPRSPPPPSPGPYMR